MLFFSKEIGFTPGVTAAAGPLTPILKRLKVEEEDRRGAARRSRPHPRRQEWQKDRQQARPLHDTFCT